jgi:phosphoribosylformylglycinamidine synthase
VTGGNVSLYNETSGTAIYPTPVIGMVGIIDDLEHITRHAFRREGDVIMLLGRNTGELGASEYLYALHGLVGGAPPRVDLMGERVLQQAVLAMIGEGLLRSAHDCSEGGLVCALAESALDDGEEPLGIHVRLADTLPPAALFFGEAQGRVVVSCDPGDLDRVRRHARSYGVPCTDIGTVGAIDGGFVVESANARIEADIREVSEVYFGALPERMDAHRSKAQARGGSR